MPVVTASLMMDNHEVGESTHRQRLLAGMAAAIAQRPYSEVTVTDIVRFARTSRRTFYQHFADKQGCLLALIHESHQRILATIAAKVDPSQPWTVQVRQSVETWIDEIRDHPGATLNWIRTVPALGTEARAMMRRTLAAYADLIRRFVASSPFAHAGIRPPSPPEMTMMLGALRELIATTVEDGAEISSIVDVATSFIIRMLLPISGAESLAPSPAPVP
jgi:AcrR family transcriptional regulator